MLQHYRFTLPITDIEKEQLLKVVARNIGKMKTTSQDLRYMMYFYYKRYAPTSSDAHINRIVTKNISCGDCRAKCVSFLEKWYNQNK